VSIRLAPVQSSRFNNGHQTVYVIFDNLWKFTGISVKYKTQIGTNDHKLSKILFTQTGRLIWKFQVQGYVFTVHDFCHDSANQASLLALAAPKIQGSKVITLITCHLSLFT